MTTFRFRNFALLAAAALSACGKVSSMSQEAGDVTEMNDRLGNIEERLNEVDDVQANLVNQVAQLENSKLGEGNPLTNMQDVLDHSSVVLEKQEQDQLKRRVDELERQRLFSQ